MHAKPPPTERGRGAAQCTEGASRLAEIFDDAYVRNRSTAEQRARLFEHPSVVTTLREDALADLRSALVPSD